MRRAPSGGNNSWRRSEGTIPSPCGRLRLAAEPGTLPATPPWLTRQELNLQPCPSNSRMHFQLRDGPMGPTDGPGWCRVDLNYQPPGYQPGARTSRAAARSCRVGSNHRPEPHDGPALPPTPLHVGGGRVLTGDSAAHPPGLEPADVGERTRTADVVPLKSAPKEADEQGSSAMPRPSRRPARHATRRRSLPRAAAVPAEGDRYVSLAEAGELYSVSQEPSADASAKEPHPCPDQ